MFNNRRFCWLKSELNQCCEQQDLCINSMIEEFHIPHESSHLAILLDTFQGRMPANLLEITLMNKMMDCLYDHCLCLLEVYVAV